MFRPPGDEEKSVDAPGAGVGSNKQAANVNLEPRPHTSCRSASPQVTPSPPNIVALPSNNKLAADSKRSPSGRRNSPKNVKNDFDSSLMVEFDQKVRSQLQGCLLGSHLSFMETSSY